MGSGLKNKKKLSLKMGDYIPTDGEILAYNSGVRRGIRISPRAVSSGNASVAWYIEVYSQGRWVRSPESYPKVEIWREIYKAYDYYYQKEK